MDIINDLLDLSRIEAGKLVLEEGTVDLGTLARDTIKAIDGDVHEKSLAIALRGFETPIKLRADRRLMRQILLNLVSNAAKFNRVGGSIDLSVHRWASGDLSIAIADTGIGIDPDIIPELFQTFRQANSRVAREYRMPVLCARTPQRRLRND